LNSDEAVLALIPAKGTSERLPQKNLRLLAGRPLVSYAVEAALQAGIFSEVCVSTEDEEIARIARDLGASVPFVRPKELSDSSARLVRVCLHALQFYGKQGRQFSTMALLIPTSPLRTAQDIRDCYHHFKECQADALMTYSEFEHSPYWALEEKDGFLHPLFLEETRKGRHEQPIPYRHNGAVLLIGTDVFQKAKEFYVDNLVGWYLPPPNGIDIDTEVDLLHAEKSLAQRSDANRTNEWENTT